MALQLPEFLQSAQYSAADLRFSLFPHLQEGIVGGGDMAVTQRSSGANMSVDIAAGRAYVQGDSATSQGLYHVYNDAVTNVTVTASDATNPRIDMLILEIEDQSYGAAADQARFRVVTGTPTASATLANLSGAPSLPASSLLLAFIRVPNGATTVTDANIGGYVDPKDTSRGAITAAPAQYALGRPGGPIVPQVRVTNTVAQTISNATTTALTFDTEAFDTGTPSNNMHDTVTNNSRVVCKAPGLYRIAGSVPYNIVGTVNARIAALRLNGSTTIPGSANDRAPSGSYQTPIICTATYRLGFSDYIELITFQNSGAPGDTFAGLMGGLANMDARPALEMTWVSA